MDISDILHGVQVILKKKTSFIINSTLANYIFLKEGHFFAYCLEKKLVSSLCLSQIIGVKVKNC